MDGSTGDSRPELPTLRRSSPLRFFHGVLFVLGGGLALFWSRWGLVFLVAWAAIGLVRLKAKAATLDMGQERLRLDRLRGDLASLLDVAEHPDGSVEQGVRALELLHRLGGISSADYEARRAQLIGRQPGAGETDGQPG